MRLVPIQQYKNIGKQQPIFLLGNGESLPTLPLDEVPAEYKMAMNRSWKFGRAKYYATLADTRYLGAMLEYRPEYLFMAGSAYEIPGNVRKKLESNVTCIPRKFGLESLDLTLGWKPTHTGLFAIHVAWYLGFSPIFLVAYDGYGCHFEADQINPLRDHDRHTEELREFKKKLPRNAEIYNTNPVNAYQIFPIMSFKEALSYHG